jgi:hypothetical protein
MRPSVQDVPAGAKDAYLQLPREARKERPPANMDEYFRGWAAFFNGARRHHIRSGFRSTPSRYVRGPS